MSLDAQYTALTKIGSITIDNAGIRIEGFEASNATCRDVAVLAALWGIGQLQGDCLANVEQPGGGISAVD